MKQVLGAVILGALIGITYAQPQKPRIAPSPNNKLLQANQAWVIAYENCDNKVLEDMTSPEFISSNFVGGVEARSEFLTNIKCDNEGSQPEQATLDEVRVGSFGDVAVVNCRSRGKDADDSGVRYTNVFVKRRDRWRIVSSHSTIILSGDPILVPAQKSDRE